MTANTAQRVAVQKWVSTSSHGGMVAVVTNAPERTYVKWTDYAALEAKLAAQAAEIAGLRSNSSKALLDKLSAAERAREESIQALRAADEWIANAPHGENCFVSDHYEGDPGNRCNCGRESVLNYIMETRNNVDAAFLAANGGSNG